MTRKLLSSTDVGDANRARLLRALYRNGAMSRANLADYLGVSRATITAIVTGLMNSGMLRELPQGPVSRAGGKPPKPLWFTDGVIGAVYVSGSSVDVALVSTDGRIVDKQQGAFDEVRSDLVVAGLRERFDAVLGGQELLGVGVAVAGTVDSTKGLSLVSHRTPFATNLPLGPLLEQWYGVPAAVDLHPRVQGIGDHWFGRGRQLDNFASVFADDVIGVGLIQDGQVVRGLGGAGGEVGHMVVDMSGEECECGRRGCWETVASVSWLRRWAHAQGLRLPAVRPLTFLSEAADDGHLLAAQALQSYAQRLGLGLANMEQLLGVGTYIIHGAPTDAGERLRHLVEAATIEGSPRRDPQPRVIFAEVPDEMTLLGAAGLVLARAFPTFERATAAPRD